MPKLSAAGRSIDASFSISQIDRLRFHVFFESRSGSKGSPAARNTQYEEGLEVLFARLFNAGVAVESIALSPDNKKGSTVLSVPGIAFPWDRHGKQSPHELRIQLGRVQASSNRKPGAKGGGNHSKRLRLICRAEESVNKRELEAVLLGANSDVERLVSIVAELEQRAAAYRIGNLQKIRMARAAKPERSEMLPIFGTVQRGPYGPYVHHKGGRSEMQFNLGIEADGEQLRFWVAFSFEPSRSMPWPALEETLTPKVARFNEFVHLNFENFADLRMWCERNNTRRGPDELPGAISHERIASGVFIFLGGRQRVSELDFDAILSTLDRLFAIYLYIERPNSDDSFIAELATRFTFEPKPWKERVVQTEMQPSRRVLDVSLRHNEVQKALHRSLVVRFGKDCVDYEVACHSETRADVVVRVNHEYWFYEIKTAGSARHCIREAFGQLLEYAYWPGAPPVTRLVVVGEGPLDALAQSYLSSLRSRFLLPIEYEQVTCDLPIPPPGGAPERVNKKRTNKNEIGAVEV